MASDDDLEWRLGARVRAHDYGIFQTAFVDGEHPRTRATKRFSLLECVDWVNVIALTDANEVVLVRQFRVGTGTLCLEIPGGMVDAGEAPAEAAARELVEETGFTARAWRPLGVVAPNPAIQSNRLHTFLATGARATHGQELDSNEVIAIELRSLAEVQRMIREGAIDHALVVAAFAHLAVLTAELRAP